MGLDVANREGAAPVIELAFGDPSARERWGTNMVTTSVILIGPPPPKLPGLEQMLGGLRKTDPRKAREARAARAQGEKYDIRERFFGAELRQYRAEVKLLTAVGFWVKNRSSTTARDVRIQIDGIIVEGLRIVDETDYPKEPNSLDYFSSVAGLVDRDLWVEKHGRSWTAHLSVGKLQPHAECLAAGQTVYRCSQAAGGADGSDHLWRQYT